MILAGDIGGTKTNLAIFEVGDGGPGRVVAHEKFPSREFPSLQLMIEKFLAGRALKLRGACFGIAGPVIQGVVKTPNLPWTVTANDLARMLDLPDVSLLNDLEATAYGIDTLGEHQLHTLNEGEPRTGNRALIAAGTGLGIAGVFWDGQWYRPIASEGGHADLAPRDEIQIDLLRYLTARFNGHVSYERVLSGPGLFDVYCFLRERKFADEPPWLAQQLAGGADRAATVSAAALQRKSKLAEKALDIFVDLYGAMGGNLVLMFKAIGGLYVGGGIAPKILDKLKDGSFMRGYSDKGRFTAFVRSAPVRVILDDKTALYGAARHAIERTG